MNILSILPLILSILILSILPLILSILILFILPLILFILIHSDKGTGLSLPLKAYSIKSKVVTIPTNFSPTTTGNA
jgi:hypothetical protein